MRQIEFLSYLDTVENNRIRVRLLTENGNLIDVMYQIEKCLSICRTGFERPLGMVSRKIY